MISIIFIFSLFLIFMHSYMFIIWVNSIIFFFYTDLNNFIILHSFKLWFENWIFYMVKYFFIFSYMIKITLIFTFYKLIPILIIMTLNYGVISQNGINLGTMFLLLLGIFTSICLLFAE